jgi:hypothetical protein
MSNPTHQEPQVSFLVLDFRREQSARLCLQSIRQRVKFADYKIIYCHNGLADYPVQFMREGLIDELIMPRENGGLGLGTRALFAACFSPYAIYWQCDQVMGRDFTKDELNGLTELLGMTCRAPAINHHIVQSISLAGAPCGQHVYSERAHIIDTKNYKRWEGWLPLSAGGAGPFHHLEWREGQIQRYYRENDYYHWTDWPQLAIDNGRDAVRQNPDGSIWRHEPDRKGLWLMSGPVKERYIYPKLTDAEWESVLSTQNWPAGKIPEQEVKDSFHVWN